MEPAISHPEQNKELVSGAGACGMFLRAQLPTLFWEHPEHPSPFRGMPHQGGQKQQEGEHTQGCWTSPVCQLSPCSAHAHSYLPMPCRSLKLSFSSGCCGLPALSMNTRRDGVLLRTCQQDGKEKFTQCRVTSVGV